MAVGIVSTGVYIPETIMTAEEIAEQSGLPVDVVENENGHYTKSQFRVQHDHTVAMGIMGCSKKHCEKEILIRKQSI